MVKQKKTKKKSSHSDMQFVTSNISTTMVLILLGLVVAFSLTANNLSVYVRENINFSFLLSDETSPQQAMQLMHELRKQPYVKNLQYISKDQALKEQTAAMGTNPSDFLGYNPFTASVEVKLHSAYANSDSITKISNAIRHNSNVKDVLYQQGLLDAVNSNIRNISAVLLGLAFLLTLISFALINNTIRQSIHSKRFLIHTMKLVGASWGFIRKPFLLRSAWGGLIAGVFANAILWIGVYWLVNLEPTLGDILTWNVMAVVTLSVLVFGVLITLLCAYLSINKYLRMKASTLYYV
ncbi:MAG: cell division protein FtsX [Bacteroidales bacterium]|nr:cell division protein FtsX [Bacteroidales bacterium]